MDELQGRFDARESRPDDLARVAELEAAVAARDEAIAARDEALKVAHAEMQNREVAYNKTFASQARDSFFFPWQRGLKASRCARPSPHRVAPARPGSQGATQLKVADPAAGGVLAWMKVGALGVFAWEIHTRIIKGPPEGVY